MDRGQASITLLEAGIGILLLLSVTLGFALGTGGADGARGQAQLDTYAADVATLLMNEPPRHRDQTRLAELAATRETFEREKDEFRQRLETLLPDNLFFQLETPHGTVGYRRPDSVQVGTETVLTTEGEVTLRVWYA